MIQVQSSPNSNAALIGRYLREQLSEKGSAFSAENQLIIDVDVIGIPRNSSQATSATAQNEIIYPIRLARHQVFFGPFAHRDGPCPTCLERRWLALRPVDERRVLEGNSEGYVCGDSPWLTSFATAAIWEVLQTAFRQRRAANGNGKQNGELYALNMESLRLTKSQVVADSLCPRCATPQPDVASSALIELAPRPKSDPTSFRLIGTNDIALAEAAFINPLCGVLGPTGLPDYGQSLTAAVSGEFQVLDAFGERNVWWGGHANSYRQSMKIGMLEGLERQSGLLPRSKQVTVIDCLSNLGEDALDPRECGLYEPSYYEVYPGYEPFTPERRLRWVWGYSLTERRPILVPKQLVYYMDYKVDEPMFVQDCSNGCAAGSCLEEAIFFSLLELIERDSFLISWFARLSLPRIDPWSCRSTDILQALDRIDLLGCDVHLLDMRLDLKIPSVMCFTRRRDDGLGAFVLAAGASFNPEDAIRGALCEVASYLPSAPRRVAASEPLLREIMQDFRKLTAIYHHPLLFGLPEMAGQTNFLLSDRQPKSVEETYQKWNEERPFNLDLRADVQYCIEQLNSIGLKQVIVVDQTSPEQERLGLKTACVIVPGLLPIDFGYERQRIRSLPRLYTVPRTAGLRATDLTPAEINPLPHPFP
ncbi:MAG TPA: TOMM precursor leader peptide-binding protein [Pyrinomonadaceae bacterium]|jgi:ribosomal protein S12 methylthiotransferase accessory factor